MKNAFNILILLLFFCGEAYALDGFETVKCGSNIPAGLIGKHMPNERVVVIEGLHRDLGLKDLGGTEVSEHLFLISGLICGNEYMLLEEKHKYNSVVRDVVLLPSHSKTSPEFIGSCQVNNQEMSEDVVAVLDNGAEHKVNDSQPRVSLTTRSAWKIDEKNAKFV